MSQSPGILAGFEKPKKFFLLRKSHQSYIYDGDRIPNTIMAWRSPTSKTPGYAISWQRMDFNFPLHQKWWRRGWCWCTGGLGGCTGGGIQGGIGGGSGAAAAAGDGGGFGGGDGGGAEGGLRGGGGDGIGGEAGWCWWRFWGWSKWWLLEVKSITLTSVA
ncbi:hypothetical protein NE237_003514 [Protea cynaroides]|uniref:Uncharacterized protein n=1 Tax=Protea cynaroides TaxID=273540 RepID=A0A9Q0KH86_9MAGN|nr:hypothetical protein NE237_003514 [Protea cynaroides]